MKHLTNKFAKEMAIRNVLHSLDTPESYGGQSWAGVFDMITGDTAFDALPEALRLDVGSQSDLNNLAEDLNEAYSVVMDVLRAVVSHKDSTWILQGVEV